MKGNHLKATVGSAYCYSAYLSLPLAFGSVLLLCRGHKSCLCFLLQNVYYTSSQQLHVGVLSPTIDDDDNRCLVDVNSRPRLIECNYAKAKRMKLYWQFTQVILPQQPFLKVLKLCFCVEVWVICLWTEQNQMYPCFLCTEPRSWCLVLVSMSATSVGYKTCIIFSQFTTNNLFLRKSTVMGEEKMVISVESNAK